MECMVMFQYSTCDMHFGIVKNYGFISKFFFKLPTECFSLIHYRVKSTNAALKKGLSRIVCVFSSFQKTENNIRGNMD